MNEWRSFIVIAVAFVSVYTTDLNQLQTNSSSSNISDVKIHLESTTQSVSSEDVTSTSSSITNCEMDTDCYMNEKCQMRSNNRSRFGLCVCVSGYEHSLSDGSCTKLNKTDVALTSDSNYTNNISSTSQMSQTTLRSSLTQSTVTTAKPIRKLTVSAGANKVLRLPENSVSISAFAIPKPAKGEKYQYEWTLLSQPDGDDTGRIEDQSTKTLRLSNLKAGLYAMKIAVTGKDAYGETEVNVTVLPPKRVNKHPVAMISPKNSSVNLPNTIAVLDGSLSTDDDKIKSYHWEQVTSPLGYNAKLTKKATLRLKNLVPGFYQFKLTVTDTDGATNSTIANLTVLKETDYPPVANAGEDVVLFLPNNNYVLNGNLSTDDKGIKSWEWTKSPDTILPVDMQGTQTPYLSLGNLQKGIYKFILKVTDDSDQTNSADVHIFVKEHERKEPPKVVAGKDQIVDLEKKVITLDGSGTKDDGDTYRWHWTQISGPTTVKIIEADKKITKVTEITVGKYEFQLEVTNKDGLKGTGRTTVTVKQVKNQPPKANAGGDVTVVIPVTIVTLNGSLSSDDRGIESYKWTRDPSSLAAGEIVENSDTKPVLKIINMIPGRYLFKLTVGDIQGKSSSDSASLIVKQPEDYKDHVQITLNVDLNSFTEENKETVTKKLALLLDDGSPVKVNTKKITSEMRSGRVVIVFNATSTNSKGGNVRLKGPEVAKRLKQKLHTDNNLLDFDIISLETVVCQNLCSGHGACEPYGKRCICDAFWMENFFRAYSGDRESNCDWSILYFVIVLSLIIISIAALTWTIICSVKNRKKMFKPKKRHRYTLINDNETGDDSSLLSKGKKQNSSVMISESDSDVLFESTREKQHNGSFKMNGLNRHSRRIKA